MCKKPADVPAEILKLNHIPAEEFEGTKFFEPRGCSKCNGMGYRGRAALMEIMLVNEEIRELILGEGNAAAIRDAASKTGMATLRDVGLEYVRQGLTSIEEIIRVTSGH